MDIVKQLPQELKEIVWSYVSLDIKIWITKEYYEKFHSSLILPYIPDFNKYITYIIIKKDNYIFDNIYNEKKTHWQRQYLYNNTKFKTYELFIKHKAEQYENHYVINTIKQNNKSKLSKTVFKEKRKYLTWRT